MARKQEYTKEEVSRVLKEVGYLSQIKIAQHPDLPSRLTIIKLFKTTKMSDVWKELNIPSPKFFYTKKEVSKALKEIGYLKTIEIELHPDLPSLSTVYRLFKTAKINDIWKEIGIPTRTIYTKEEISKALKETGYLKLGEINQHPDLPSLSTVYRLFKTAKINDVWKELGIPVRTIYTKEEVSKALKKIGYLTQKEIDQHPDIPTRQTIIRLFKVTKMSDVWKKLNIEVPQNKP